jgi:Icc-related predicted phosphoesterase
LLFLGFILTKPKVKLLLTADFHFHKPWFDWILRVADRYDLVCIAGDLLDMFHPDGVVPQLIYVYEWMQILMKLKVPVALCSGNHDLLGNNPILVSGVSIRKDKLQILGEFAKHRHWLHSLKMNHLVAVDDDSKIIRTRGGEAITVVCLPYAADGHVQPLNPASQPYLILHHEPPAQTRISEPKDGSREFALVVARQQPTWTLSGHVHFTLGAENDFSQRIGNSWCFNCRQTPPAVVLPPEPNFIVLDTKKREASWFHWPSLEKAEELKVSLPHPEGQV